MASVWRESFPVRPSDADPKGRVTVPALCRHLQDAAGHHAHELGFSLPHLLGRGQTWVLAQLALEIDDAPGVGNEVTVETWAAGRSGGARACRDFLLFDGRGEAFGRAATLWLVLDVATRRPVRMPEALLAVCARERGPVVEEAEPLQRPERAEHERRFTVGLQDLDANEHANNVRHVEWMLEAVPEETWRTRGVRRLDLRFTGEARLGDEVVSMVEERAEGFRHGLVGREGKVVGVGRTRWGAARQT